MGSALSHAGTHHVWKWHDEGDVHSPRHERFLLWIYPRWKQNECGKFTNKMDKTFIKWARLLVTHSDSKVCASSEHSCTRKKSDQLKSYIYKHHKKQVFPRSPNIMSNDIVSTHTNFMVLEMLHCRWRHSCAQSICQGIRRGAITDDAVTNRNLRTHDFCARQKMEINSPARN